jgi:hypothetical protein
MDNTNATTSSEAPSAPAPQPSQTFSSDFDGLKDAANELQTRREVTSTPDTTKPEEIGYPTVSPGMRMGKSSA